LDTIASDLGFSIGGEECEAMVGLVRESEEIVSAEGNPTAKDAALIPGAQRVEHYEIAAYGTVKVLADELGYDAAKDLLETTDELLTKIATGGLFNQGWHQRSSAQHDGLSRSRDGRRPGRVRRHGRNA
jgi:ferritin-like metal-binding protein YciE